MYLFYYIFNFCFMFTGIGLICCKETVKLRQQDSKKVQLFFLCPSRKREGGRGWGWGGRGGA